MSKFYIVATPIGNMGDITLRAIETLKSVDLILCEDTRETKKILDKYGINKPTMSYPSDDIVGKNSRQSNKFAKIFELLEEGKNLALVSDAGTPGISDPGAMLVSKIKTNLRHGVDVIPIPGPTALITALSASGLPIHEFTFLGFLPHKKGRKTLFKEISESKRTVVFYESPHRILKTLESLVKFCPKENQKKVCVARELTKIYEEFKIGNPAEILEYLNKNPEKQRGEFTVIVA
ncbi:16S rRNA (cytidine(1402)-2'-O)-methyltransferase [Candidatus Nomurabacteria bacterium RIFCSPHIGHO2_01_FULL_39_220]|uniref:Ribosomal RNA small subunit methyltransferase I n=1 Tax=Candidatus Nomurabacteria bacterium RIFCSPLOWO2_02_FULL_40_67 TaxID=1801787 RepID=A0A1F6Y6A3_9BACT|nr:MAG: Ribosomal RNA small subunit methyltransferase I [Parcubacteria group bacterium GW2011_GWA2_40_37]OGI61603.1 MAG: 16S rRNA (cytidine(1402)-2'-O)-methyltransferase [Candidatus Nomurabacteria bacterium RBG_16_40_11]OGI70370.1 MAG: 16S rRNA (cytidine(1402)-2'-O)-methyltransferase [Candidatus Nomurabacteria bacterium RIFCSPHIGHO2_01_FULL_39_220]OGI72510.1 MAG: 16S rRNA (cytidine(1402)-2'-O)-methyltransferase [Candidatus Nomurabacteria bacterium RIFCSPHIGHO2_02_41_18]OGI78550.1 MAG: 16S rRNA 